MTIAVTTKSASELFGVKDIPKNARDRLLIKAIDLFYTYGFHSIGLDRIIDEVGVTKTTFYKHFESKDELLLEAIKRRDAWESKAWQRAVKKLAGDDPKKQLIALFDVFDIWFNDPDFRGCIFLNAAAEFADPRDPIHQAAAQHKKKSWEDARDLARAAGARDPNAFADQYTLLVEGTLILRHVHARNDAAKIARASAERLVSEYIG